MELAGDIGRRLVAQMDQMTWDRIGDMAFANAVSNLSRISSGRSIAELRGAKIGRDDSAIVIAAGPSIARHDPIKQIKAAGYDGAIVATESAIYYCLRNGVVPDLVVTVDPHGERLVRWFGRPELDDRQLARDDYFRRQDMDSSFAKEHEANKAILSLLEQYGKGMRIALATSSAPEVCERVLQIGMEVYWWNPMLDSPDLPNSRTTELYRKNSLPCINAGGNVGTAAWMIADAVLGTRHVALTGVDFSYYPDTPYRNTQYYEEIIAVFGEEGLDRVFNRIRNPYLDVEFFTDPAYLWYRDCFLELAADANCVTYNCTEGGILFGGPIHFVPLAEFLRGRVGGTPGTTDGANLETRNG
jgi:hypothetical protein